MCRKNKVYNTIIFTYFFFQNTVAFCAVSDNHILLTIISIFFVRIRDEIA